VEEAVSLVRVDPLVVGSAALTAVVSAGVAVCDDVFEVVGVDAGVVDAGVEEGDSSEDVTLADEPPSIQPDSPAPTQAVASARITLRRVRRSQSMVSGT
jgi:hypothetical protein